jgi:adenosylhomocysteine nucleosidase
LSPVSEKFSLSIYAGLSVNIENIKYGIVMAMPIEAGPFIQGMGLEQAEIRPFPVYIRENVYLIVSGIGRVRASSASAYLISRYNPEIMINPGTAGSNSADAEAGTVFSISNVYDRDLLLYRGPEIFKYDMETIIGAPSASLLTSDRPCITSEERAKAAEIADLSDMEGAAFAQVCSLFNKKGYIFKIVSDAPGAESFKSVREGIKMYSGDLFNYFKREINI